MKSKFILATSVAMALAASAQAETLIITGATAMRSAMNSAIIEAYPSAKIVWSTESATSLDKAKFAVYDDSANSGTIIKTSFSGSVEGIEVLTTTGATVPVIDTTVVALPTTGGTSNALSYASPAKTGVPAQAAFSDVFQSSTTFTSPTLSGTQVGVVPFVWATNSFGKSIGINNITNQLAVSVLVNDGTQASLFTGNATHQDYPVYATGRNWKSGTRMTALAEIGFPKGFGVYQYKVVSASELEAYDTDDGYGSGSDVMTALNTTMTGDYAELVLVGYSSVSDATSFSTLWLNYNGTPYSAAAVKNGSYTFWGYENLFWSGNITTGQKAVVNNIISKIPTYLTNENKGIALSAMKCARKTDGSYVYFKP